MKKSYSKLLILVMALVMSMSMAANVFAEGEETTPADGKYVLNEITSTLSMVGNHIVAPTKLVVDGEDATLTLTCDNSVAKRFAEIYIGKYADITPENQDTIGIKAVEAGENVVFTIPLKTKDLGSDLYYVMRYRAGYSEKHDHDWYEASQDHYFTLGALTPVVSQELTITNSTGMFKAVTAALETAGDQETLVMALSGSGYHELFNGTYQKAVANGDATENWIHGYKNDEGKWEFAIPLESGKDYYALVAISNSYYQKYLSGQNSLERAFYPRQLEVDRTAKTLVTGDYDETFDVPVENNVSMFKPGKTAKVHAIGGPNSNNYSVTMTLPMESNAMDMVRAATYDNMGGTLVENGEVEIAVEDVDGVKTFKDIPLKDGLNVIEFHSKNNGNWYKRDFTIDLDTRVSAFDPHKAGSKFFDMTEEEVLAYVKKNASVDLLNELIEAIQVQYRDENTDKLCKAAKACWDALPDAEKEEDDGYFSDDTGDASADDPLNQDEIGEKELLVVSFGTSFNDSRANDIGGIEKALAKAYPGWSVRRAFTAQIIINHVQARDGEKIDNMEQALDRAVANGVKELVVQPTHLMHGAEYDELKEAVDAYADKFDSVVIAEPLLGQVGDEAATVNADKEAAAKAAVAEAVKVAGFDSLDAAEKDGTAFVFMGHGTAHDAAITYDQMQNQMKELGYNNVFIGTVEGNPADTALPEVKKAVEAAGYEHVILRPLMVVAGDHANNDMAADEEGSWYYAFVNGDKFEVEGSDGPVDIGEGFGADNVKCQIEGLGRIPAVQKMYVAHTMDAINEIEPITKINSKVLELVQNQELIDAYLKASAFVDEYKPLVDAIVKNLDNGDTSDIEAYGRQLDELIKEMYDYAADYAAELEEDPEIKAAIDEVIAKAEELNDLLKEYGIDLSDGISDEEKAIIEEKIEEAKADLDKAIADLMDALNEEVLKEALDEFIAQAKDWAKDAAKEAGLTDEEIEEFMKQIEDLAAIVEEYAGMEPSEALDKLIEDAKALIEENADELKELAQQAINDAYEAFQNGDYDEYIAKTGLDPETVKAAVDDLVAYAMGAAAGDTYTALQDKVAALTEQLEKAQADAAAAQDALDQLKKDAEAQKASAEEKDAVIKQFINGYNVTKKKPTMKKAKAAKKKKVKVTFKGLKGAEATSYQISYKTGKKTKKKTVKKATTSAKKLNYTLKKLKKGKKYTVKVRAIYQFKYNGKTYKFMSKWSKGKKVKVK